ncbi:MAG: pyridoxine 5'-phosphate synthase [Lentisphaerae bacterium]|nr:pyridoxine 5'-phosphate synthase [Lentisphaerota bacterium]
MAGRKLQLGVNIDHVATVRQVRKTAYPSLVEAASLCEKAGAHGITIHLREDRRHIQDSDVFALRRTVRTRLNLEMANAGSIVRIALEVAPDEVCIVPERREELTTEGGLNVIAGGASLARNVRRLSDAGIAVSLFIEPDIAQLRAALGIGAPVVELHTGKFCDSTGRAAERELKRLREAAAAAHDMGLQVNAGHGINTSNMPGILAIPHLDTLNIGHSIVARAVMVGMAEAVREMLRAMVPYRGGERARKVK